MRAYEQLKSVAAFGDMKQQYQKGRTEGSDKPAVLYRLSNGFGRWCCDSQLWGFPTDLPVRRGPPKRAER